MADEWIVQNSMVTRTLAFLGGTPEEQARQKCEIQNDRNGPYLEPSGFFSDWDKMEIELRDGHDCVVLTDLTVIPGDCAEVADRLFRCIQRRITIWPLNDEQRVLLGPSQYYNLPEGYALGAEKRIRYGLERLCQMGWQEADADKGDKQWM